MCQLRVMVADVHRPFLRLSQALLKERYDLVGTVRDGLELLAAAREVTPDVIIIGVTIPYLGGIEACRRLSHMLPDTKVVLLTADNERNELDSAMKAGACGYVLKRCPPAELCRAIDEVIRGRIYVTPLIAARSASAEVVI